MSKFIRIGDVEFDAQQYAINGTGILGIKKSGKSWLGKGVAEQMLTCLRWPVAEIPKRARVFPLHWYPRKKKATRRLSELRGTR